MSLRLVPFIQPPQKSNRSSVAMVGPQRWAGPSHVSRDHGPGRNGAADSRPVAVPLINPRRGSLLLVEWQRPVDLGIGRVANGKPSWCYAAELSADQPEHHVSELHVASDRAGRPRGDHHARTCLREDLVPELPYWKLDAVLAEMKLRLEAEHLPGADGEREVRAESLRLGSGCARLDVGLVVRREEVRVGIPGEARMARRQDVGQRLSFRDRPGDDEIVSLWQ